MLTSAEDREALRDDPVAGPLVADIDELLAALELERARHAAAEEGMQAMLVGAVRASRVTEPDGADR